MLTPEPMSDERLAEIEAFHMAGALSGNCGGCNYDVAFPCDAVELTAEIRRLRFDAEWVKGAVTSNGNVCEDCAAEIARAVGWS